MNLPRLAQDFTQCRTLTNALIEGLSDADASAQSMADTSPAKWHLAHTSWFFEAFILRDNVADYKLFDSRWPFLFNSYYEGEGNAYAVINAAYALAPRSAR